jgi:hypothetical protein
MQSILLQTLNCLLAVQCDVCEAVITVRRSGGQRRVGEVNYTPPRIEDNTVTTMDGGPAKHLQETTTFSKILQSTSQHDCIKRSSFFLPPAHPETMAAGIEKIRTTYAHEVRDKYLVGWLYDTTQC